MMGRLSFPALLAAGAAVFCFACSDQLPPLPDSGGAEDGATHDVSSPDGTVRPDVEPRPDVGPAPDLGPGGCFDNGGCLDTEYCKIEQGCDGPGSCVERPLYGCPEVWMPECGCDGQTYSNRCEAESAGVNIRHAGECGGPAGCSGNGECGPLEFCNLDYDCAMRHQPGSCELKPTGCNYLWAPVCGCDNMDYNNACEAHMASVSVLHDGECGGVDPTVCAALDASYREAVATAKICSDDTNTTYQCDLEVQDALTCGCPTYITQFDSNAVQALDALWIEWGMAGCNMLPNACPPYACPAISGARCGLSSDGVGACIDY